MNFFRRWMLNRARKRIFKCISDEIWDTFLETLFRLMRLVFLLDKKYRRNIEGFNARYAFKSEDGRIAASVIFKKSKMSVKRHAVDNTNVTVKFKNSQALKEFLFNENPDIIGAILENKISYDGNLNYLSKFAFMAKHLQLRFSF